MDMPHSQYEVLTHFLISICALIRKRTFADKGAFWTKHLRSTKVLEEKDESHWLTGGIASESTVSNLFKSVPVIDADVAASEQVVEKGTAGLTALVNRLVDLF